MQKTGWTNHSSFLVLSGLEKGFTLDLITSGQSTTIFLCIGPFLAWWLVTNKRTNHQVILEQACSWPVWEGSLLQFRKVWLPNLVYLLPRNRFGNFYSSPTRVFTTETQQEAVEAANALMGRHRHRQAQAPPCPMVSMLLVPAASLYTTTTIVHTPKLQTFQNTQCSSLPCDIDDAPQFRQDILWDIRWSQYFLNVPAYVPRRCDHCQLDLLGCQRWLLKLTPLLFRSIC